MGDTDSTLSTARGDDEPTADAPTADKPSAAGRNDALRAAARQAMSRDTDTSGRPLTRGEDAADWVKHKVAKRRPEPAKVPAGPAARAAAANAAPAPSTKSAKPVKPGKATKQASPARSVAPTAAQLSNGAAAAAAAPGSPTVPSAAGVSPATASPAVAYPASGARRAFVNPTVPGVPVPATLRTPPPPVRLTAPNGGLGPLSKVPLARTLAGLLLVLVGAGMLLGWVVHVSWSPLLDVFLIAIGVVLLIQARFDRPSRPLMALGLLLAFLSFATWRADVTLDGGVGNRTVTSLDGTDQELHLAVGQLTLDLRELEASTTPATVRADVGVGRLVVRLPKNAAVRVDTIAGVGQTYIVQNRHLGSGVTDTSYPGRDVAVILDLHVGAGSVEVQH